MSVPRPIASNAKFGRCVVTDTDGGPAQLTQGQRAARCTLSVTGEYVTSAVRSIGIACSRFSLWRSAWARTAAQEKALCVLFSGKRSSPRCCHVRPEIRIDHRHSDPSLKRGLLLGYSEVEDSRIHGVCGCGYEANTSEYRHRDREKMTLKFHKH